MFKRILKIVGICLAIFVGVAGGAFGIFALTGGFKEKVINITKLYIDDTTRADKEVYTLEDLKTIINCEPLDATNKKLEVIVSDPLRVYDENGKLAEEGILKNVPEYVYAGKEFELQLNKDHMGNNIGGVVTLTFRPADSDKVITDFTYKVVVDVAIPDNSLYFTGNTSDVLTTTGKHITMGISSSKQNVYLKSNLVNAFCLETSNGNLKQADIEVDYRNQKGERLAGYPMTFSDLQYQLQYDELAKKYNYYYEVPVTPNMPGTIDVVAKMHRTYEIEKEYNANNFDNIPTPSVNSNAAQLALDKYNAFLNKYIAYFDTSEESYLFFKPYITSEGLVKLPYGKVDESKKYVFQSCKTSITVTAVNLTEITSIDTPREYKVLASKTFTLDDLIREYDLSVVLDHDDDLANIAVEKKNLFKTLEINPYIFVEREEYIKNSTSLWADYEIAYGVEKFDNGKPVVVEWNADSINTFEGEGVLLLMEERLDSKYHNYITISSSADESDKYWTFEFNIPLKNDSVAIDQVKKALFVEFKVTGRNLQKNEEIIRNTFSRVFIDYTEYEFNDVENARIGFPNPLSRMTINHSVENIQGLGYSEKLYVQDIDIKLAESIKNYNAVQYKSVMYFVEEKSNQIAGGGSKVASIGKYDFKYMTNSNSTNDDMVKRFGTAENLVGERLLYEGTKLDPKYYIYALNASVEPINVFAVVYLSDREGNPIDVNGKIIKVNEEDSYENNTLVVFAITDVTESGIAKVYIDSFVDNLNYYTIGGTLDIQTDSETKKITVTPTASQDTYLKRNIITSYKNENGEDVSESELKEIQDALTLKFLHKKPLDIYVTNFELDSAGAINTDEGYDNNKWLYMDIRDFNGNVISKEYEINTQSNKQFALNYLWQDFSNYELNVKANNSQSSDANPILSIKENVEETESGENILGITFTIYAEEKISTTDDYIYIKVKQGKSPVNALSESNDFVNWKVSKIKVTDVNLDIEDNDYSLVSRYDSTYQQDTANNQQFYTVTIENGKNKYSAYTLYTREGESQPGSIEDNIGYTITNNLVTDPNDPANSLNTKIIDVSQLLYDSSNPDDTTYYKDIKSYIDYYLRNSNNMNISYLNSAGQYKLEEKLIFYVENGVDENTRILINDKNFEVTNNQFTIGKQSYPVENNKFTIAKDTYLPISNYKNAGRDVVMILDQEFVVETRNESGSEKFYIYNTTNTNNSDRKAFKISKTSFDPHEYIDDGTRDTEKKDTALIDTTNNGVTVNFIKGEYDSTSEKGVTTHLMITFNGVAFDKPITKVITYELKQVEPELEVLTQDGVKDVVKKVCDSTDAADEVAFNKIKLTAGGDKFLYFNAASEKTTSRENLDTSAQTPTYADVQVQLINGFGDASFFNHCGFEIEGSNAKLVVKQNNGDEGEKFSEVSKLNNGYFTTESAEYPGNNQIILRLGDAYESNTIKLYITYLYQGRMIKKAIMIEIEPNKTFSLKDNTDLTITDDYYQITLDSNAGGYNLNDLLDQYFNGSISLSEITNDQNNNTKGNELINIVSSTLQVGKSYAKVTGKFGASNPVVERDYAEFTMTVGGMTIAKKLRVVINPTYTIDARILSDNDNVVNIYQGQSLLSYEFIKIYHGYSMDEAQLVHLNDYKSIIQIMCESVDCTDRVTVTGKKSLNLTFANFDDNESIELTVNVVGYEFYYSENGAVGTENYDTYEEITAENTGLEKINSSSMELNVPQGVEIDINKYCAVFTVNNAINKNFYVQLKKGTDYYSSVEFDTAGNYTYTISVVRFVTDANGTTTEVVYDTGFELTFEVASN